MESSSDIGLNIALVLLGVLLAVDLDQESNLRWWAIGAVLVLAGVKIISIRVDREHNYAFGSDLLSTATPPVLRGFGGFLVAVIVNTHGPLIVQILFIIVVLAVLGGLSKYMESEYTRF